MCLFGVFHVIDRQEVGTREDEEECEGELDCLGKLPLVVKILALIGFIVDISIILWLCKLARKKLGFGDSG